MCRVTTTDEEVGFSSSSVMAGQKLVFVRRPPSLCVSRPAAVAAQRWLSCSCSLQVVDCIETDQITGVYLVLDHAATSQDHTV